MIWEWICRHLGCCVCAFCVIRVAERLLPGSKFQRYTRDGQSVVRSSAPYSVHDDVHQHLDFGENHIYSCKMFSRHLYI